jgi:AcrR family transcriptional regulator
MSCPADAELPRIAPDGGDPPMDLHLWKLPRGRHGLPRELVARSQRERLLAAVVRVTAANGYRASSVADILKEAGVGRETFYKHFHDKEDCLIAANDALVVNLEAQVGKAYEQPGDWPERVRFGLAAVLAWFASSPEAARVMMIELGTVGPIAGTRFRDTLRRFTKQLDEGRDFIESAPDLPNLSNIAGGAVYARIYEQVALRNTTSLPQLLPQLTFEVLLPYIGEEAAAREREAAEGMAPVSSPSTSP